MGTPLRIPAPLAILVVAVACGSDAPVAPTQSPPAVSGTVTGVVLGVAPASSRIARPGVALANARVTVVAGPAHGLTVVTPSTGGYALQLPPGPFRLEFTRAGYLSAESADFELPARGEIVVPDVILRTAPWSIAGTVSDSLGHPVEGATVRIRPGDAFALTYATLTTDTAGRYRFASSLPRWDFVLISAVRDRFEPFLEQPVTIDGNTAFDFRMVRVVSITPPALPEALRAGESLEVPASRVLFDDGTARNIFVLPSSSAPGVVAVSRSDVWFALRAVNAGIATLTFDHRGTAAAVPVRVVP